MSEVLIFSDIHIHTHKSSLQRLQDCLDVLDWVFKTAVDRNIKYILFLGDLFQDRQKIQILPYHKTYETFLKYSTKVNVYMIVGNHDMWYANRCDISSIFPFGSIENVTIISKPSKINLDGFEFDVLPYTNNPLESMKEFVKPSKVLLGHVSIDGAKLNTHYKRVADISVEYEGDMVKVDSQQFSRWEKVFLGHFHASQKIDNIEYIGSPLQLNFSEAFQEKHIAILDTNTLNVEYIENKFSPRHLILNDDEIDKFDLENAFVRIDPKDISCADLLDVQKNIIENKKAISVEIGDAKSSMEKQEVNEAREIMMSKDKFDMLKVYLDTIETPLDKDLLFNVGKTLIEKSQVQ